MTRHDPTQQAGLITVRTPIHHGSDENTGVERTLRRVKHMHPEHGTLELPAISGNTIRHELRAQASRDLLQRVNLDGYEDLPLKTYYVLFNGGSLQKGSQTGRIQIRERKRLREVLPHLSLFGAALSNGIMRGRLEVGNAIPYTQRTRNMVHPEPPEEAEPETLPKSHNACLDWYYQTRSKDEEKEDLHELDDDAQSQQMKVQYEAIAPGTRLHHWWTIRPSSELEASAFAHIHTLLRGAPTSLGGKSGSGFGQVSWPYTHGDPTAYREYVEENASEVREFVLDELTEMA